MAILSINEKTKKVQIIQSIQNRIYEIRGERVMLDRDLAGLGEQDVQLNQVYDALENLLDENAEQRKWEDRERIGFKSR